MLPICQLLRPNSRFEKSDFFAFCISQILHQGRICKCANGSNYPTAFDKNRCHFPIAFLLPTFNMSVFPCFLTGPIVWWAPLCWVHLPREARLGEARLVFWHRSPSFRLRLVWGLRTHQQIPRSRHLQETSQHGLHLRLSRTPPTG